MTTRKAKQKIQNALSSCLGFAPTQDKITIIENNYDGEFIKAKIGEHIVVSLDANYVVINPNTDNVIWVEE